MLNKSIQQKQKKILNYLKKYNHIRKNNYDDIYYFNTWAVNSGNSFIKKKFIKTTFVHDIIIFFKLLHKKVIDEKSEYYVEKNFLFDNIKKDSNLIISFQNDKKKGLDFQFGCERKNTKNSIWLLINLSDQNIDKNYRSIILNKKIKLNVLKKIFLLLFFFPLWLTNKKSIIQNNFLNSLNQILTDLPLYKFKKVFLPYEAQPFQRFIVNYIKKKNKKTKVIGYVHGGLPSLPVEYNLNDNIDKLIVHSKIERDTLVKKLGWKKKQIQIEKAFRFYSKNNIKKNHIYLPYDFQLNLNLYYDLKYLFCNYDLAHFKIVNHPAMYKSKRHQILIKILTHFKYKNFYNKKTSVKNTSIFIGVTGSILEGLQNNLDIIHLMNFPEFELYSSYFWRCLSSKQIKERIYCYNLRKGELIKYSRFNSFIKKFNL